MNSLVRAARFTAHGVLVPSGLALSIVSTGISFIGLLGVITTTPAFCPESVDPARCRAAGRNGALMAAYGLVAAGAGGALFAAGRLADPEA